MPTTRREVAGDTRTVLRLHPRLAPVKVAVLPLIGRTEGMTGKARPLYEELRRDGSAEYDDSASIGKRYRRQDEIGTPWAHNRLPDARDDTITIRPRLPRRRNAFRSRTRALPREQLLAPWTPRGQR
jgi:glycyl-tRNA synthetase